MAPNIAMVVGMKANFSIFLAGLVVVSGCSQAADEETAASSSTLSAGENENSAIRYEHETYDDASRRHQEIFLRKHPDGVRASDAVGPTAERSQVAVDNADLSKIPTWSDSDITTHFEQSRDVRFLTQSGMPDFKRRISWLYPDDGCFARAELVSAKADEQLHKRPYRLFAFGTLTVQTANHPEGRVRWWYHTVPVVKNAAGEVVVFDAAIDPKKTLPWKTWLGFQVPSLSQVKVSVCDGNAYVPSSACFGSSVPTSEALGDEQSYYLKYEWDRQGELGRDPEVVLGDTPPWSSSL